MIFKILGSAIVILCGLLYSKNAQRGIGEELSEVKYLLELFWYMKNEIEEFDTPLYAVLKSRGIDGGVEGLFEKVRCEKLRAVVADAKMLGRCYKKEELRICSRILTNLESEEKCLEVKAKETKVISRVKGLGTAAAAVILLL